MRKTQRWTALVIAGVSVISMAACGGGADEDARSEPADAGRTITIRMTDNAFDPTQIQVTKGEKVMFRLVNDGTVDHEAYIGTEKAQEDHAAEMAAGSEHAGMEMPGDPKMTVKPGKTGELAYTFDERGTLVVGCHQPGHWEAGMKATVTVK